MDPVFSRGEWFVWGLIFSPPSSQPVVCSKQLDGVKGGEVAGCPSFNGMWFQAERFKFNHL